MIAETHLQPARGAPGFGMTVRRFAGAHVVEVRGSVDVLGASLLASRLLSATNDGATRLVLDLGAAEATAPGALHAMLLRADRYASQRGARLVIVAGAAQPPFGASGARRWLTLAETREEALGLLGA